MKKDGRRANDNRPGFNQKRPVLEPTSPGENVCGLRFTAPDNTGGSSLFRYFSRVFGIIPA